MLEDSAEFNKHLGTKSGLSQSPANDQIKK